MARRTLKNAIQVIGVGLHTGADVQVELRPGTPGQGFTFLCAGGSRIPGHVDQVYNTRLATTLGTPDAQVSTVEHLLSALYGAGLNDVDIAVQGPEVPCLDGSARQWLAHIDTAGTTLNDGEHWTMVIDRPVQVSAGDRWLAALPAAALRLELSIDFPHPLVGRQDIALDVTPATYADELSWARTFGFLKNIEALRRMGLIQGGDLTNAIVFDDTGVLNPGGLQTPDEPVRHKALDLLGDVSLLGCPVQACFQGERPGHALVIQLLRALQKNTDAWHMCATKPTG